MPQSVHKSKDESVEGLQRGSRPTYLFFHADEILSSRDEIAGDRADALTEVRNVVGEGSTSMMRESEREGRPGVGWVGVQGQARSRGGERRVARARPASNSHLLNLVKSTRAGHRVLLSVSISSTGTRQHGAFILSSLALRRG